MPQARRQMLIGGDEEDGHDERRRIAKEIVIRLSSMFFRRQFAGVMAGLLRRQSSLKRAYSLRDIRALGGSGRDVILGKLSTPQLLHAPGEFRVQHIGSELIA